MIVNIIENLKGRFATAPNSEYTNLGFTPNVESNKLYDLLKKGWWHTCFFGDSSYEIWGLRIFPNLEYAVWSAVELTNGGSARTIAPRLCAFATMLQLDSFSDIELFRMSRRDWPQITATLNRLYELIGGGEYHDFITELLFNDANLPVDAAHKLENYLRVWKHMDPSLGHIELRKLIEQSNEDESFVPESYRDLDLGHWRTRILNAAATLATFRADHISRSQKLARCWVSFAEPHGYDPEEVRPQQYGSKSNTTAGAMQTIVEQLQGASNFMGLPLEMQDSPLFAPLVSLAGRKNQYLGVQHAEAAILFDKEYNDPLMAWNCLVSAAYWSGRNGSETLMPVWRAAIELCEANNWSDAHEALVYQWDFYHDFKKRNNLP